MIRNPQLILKQSSDISEDILRSLIDDILQMDKTQILAPQKAPIKASGNELQDLRDQIANLTKLIEDKQTPVIPAISKMETAEPSGNPGQLVESAVVPTEVVDLTSPEAKEEAPTLSKDKSE